MEFRLPDLGEGVQEGEITRWLVAKGDTVREDQPLVEVMTDKVTAEIPSPWEGVVLDLLQPEGAVVPVGTPLLRIEATDEPHAQHGADEEQAADAVAPGCGLPVPGGSQTDPEPGARNRERERGERAPRAVPLVRKLARDLGVDLRAVTGTGPAGRITEADVRAAVERRDGAERASATTARERARKPMGEAPLPPDLPPAQRSEQGAEATGSGVGRPSGSVRPRPASARIPLRGLRRQIAERMVKAQRAAAPATLVEEVDLTDLVLLREKARDTAERQGVKLTFLPFVMKAATAALREHPRLNAIVDEESEEIVLSREHHIGVACETPDGLVVPVIRDVDHKGIFDLAREIADKAQRARAGQLGREELQGSSFTITSMGVLGGLMATPILNYPEVAILGVHKIVRRPVYRGEVLQPREIAHLSLTFDHRALDGLDAARFVNTLIRYLEDPSLLLFS